MATKKQARAAQRRRYEAYEARVAARMARRRRNVRITSAIAAGALVAGGGTLALVTVGPFASEPAASPSPSSSSIDAVGPGPAASEYRDWTATIDTDLGAITMTLDGAAAPQAVASFVTLARDGFFDGVSCHRLTTSGIFVLQCGDPAGNGTGGPGYSFGPIENAPSDNVYPAGTVAMARRGGDAYSMGSQFFLVYADSTIPSDSAGGYTVFGTITDGLAILEDVAAQGTEDGSNDGRPREPVVMNEVTVE
jgi:peptidyl-prolyl cis-trans isomerase B (cyclophilin B)